LSLAVRWHADAEADLRAAASWRDAALIAAAVDGFATRGTGVVLVGDHLGDFRLLVGGYVVRFTVAAGTLSVWRVLRAR
jgi:hypothetical protein